MKKWIITLISIILVTTIAGCSGSGTSKENGNVLRIAMPSPGEALIKVWEAVGDDFESQHENITVEFSFQDDDTYQTIGLPNLLSGKNAPDLYFEWAGQRLNNRVSDGFAADITDLMSETGLDAQFNEGSFNGMIIDNKTYMIPTAGDVTNVYFYNKQIFQELGLEVPTTWEQFIEVCEKLKAADITPIVVGNKDLWPAGNWIAHLISRVVGEETYSDALQLKKPFNSTEFVTAYEYVKQLWDNGYINSSANSIADDEGDMLFLNGQAAIHPIGSWLVSSAIEESPDLELGYFNLPAINGGVGNQESVIGVLNGMVVNEKSSLKKEAVEFMQLYSSEKYTTDLSSAGAVPITIGGIDESTMDPISVSLNEMMQNAPVLVAPPDTGYDIEIADALNMATSQVLGGVKSPADALSELDAKLAPLKK